MQGFITSHQHSWRFPVVRHSFQQGEMQTIPFRNAVSLLDLCAREENEHSPKIPHVLRGLTEMVRRDQEQTPMFLSSFALKVKLDEQTVSLENMFLLSPCLYIMGLANQPVTNQLS